MSVSIYKEDGSLDPVAATFYRTFACTKDYFNDHKETIPDGTIVFITDDTDEQIKEITSNVLKIYPSASELPVSGLGLQPGIYAWCISEKAFYIADWDDEDLKTVKWSTVDTHWLDRVYPVGSIYINRNTETNPSDNSLLGFGTWTRIAGQFLYGEIAGFTTDPNLGVGTGGGAASYTLSQGNIPRHRHGWYVSNVAATIDSGTTASEYPPLKFAVDFGGWSTGSGTHYLNSFAGNGNGNWLSADTSDYSLAMWSFTTLFTDHYRKGTLAGWRGIYGSDNVNGAAGSTFLNFNLSHKHSLAGTGITFSIGSASAPNYTNYDRDSTAVTAVPTVPPYLRTCMWYRSA